MGCDIHTYCEVKRKDSKEWMCAGRIFKNSWHKTKEEFVSVDNSGYSFGEPYSIHPFDDRSYDTFAILANVRNGTWSEDLTPISQPRGLPVDVSQYVKKCSDDYDNGHSHSYVTLKELEKYDWKQKLKMNAMVNEKQAKEYKEKGIKPTTYAAYSSYGVNLEWEETYYDQCKYFVDKVIPQLQKLKKFGEVRMVFWFDSQV